MGSRCGLWGSGFMGSRCGVKVLVLWGLNVVSEGLDVV